METFKVHTSKIPVSTASIYFQLIFSHLTESDESRVLFAKQLALEQLCVCNAVFCTVDSARRESFERSVFATKQFTYFHRSR